MSTLRRVQLSFKPNPQPLPYEGRGARIKASLLAGERNGSGVSKSKLHIALHYTKIKDRQKAHPPQNHLNSALPLHYY